MDRDRWLELEPLLDEVLELPSAQRGEFLERVGRQDPELARDLTRLLDGATSELVDAAKEATDALLHEAMAVAAPSRIGRYEVLGLMGSGGMGDVYVARDPTLERRIALKLLPMSLESDASITEGLINEARIASGIDHPNVGTVYDAGWTDDGRAYLAMAHYEGETLHRCLSRGRVPVAQATEWALQVARGLSAVHDAGIVHRDIKPENLIVTDDGVVKIIDFGIALTDDHLSPPSVAGTTRYQSPEQARGERIDARSDVWAFGLLLGELLGSAAPLPGIPQPLSDDVPPELARIVSRCVSEHPTARPADGSDLVGLLERSFSRVSQRRTARARLLAAGVVVMGLAGWGMFNLFEDSPPPAPRSVAVFPFASVDADSTLQSLGRRLAVTLATSIGGVGGLQAVEPTSLLAQPAGGPSGDDRRRTALALGAGLFVSGTIVPTEDEVRLEMVVHSSEADSVLGTATIQGKPRDLAALTDSATLALLPTLWGTVRAPVPSIAALRTRSVAALEAYVDGEQAFANADWPLAVAEFERAIELDSALWIAHWRSVYPSVYEGTRSQSGARWRAAVEHRADLPGPDRGLIEVGLAETGTSRIGAAEELAHRYPTYWPAWFELGNTLVHHGPHLGHRLEEAKGPLERVVSLNPNFLPAREHVLWVDIAARRWDTALEQMDELDRRRPPHVAGAPYLPLVAEVIRHRGAVSTEAVALARDLFASAAGPEALATTLIDFGLPASQADLADSLLSFDPPRATASALLMGRGLAWATRGDWARADESLRRATALNAGPMYVLIAAGLFVSGAAAGVGELDTAELWLRRAEVAMPSPSPDQATELAWLAGVIAMTRGDEPGVLAAADRVENGGGVSSSALAEALRILALGLTDRGAAALQLGQFETARAGAGAFHGHGYTHPWFTSVNRTLAAQWALEAGRPLDAAPLLAWTESVLWEIHGPMGPANKVFSPIAARLRGLVALELGRPREAQREFETLRYFYDSAAGAAGEWVAEAERAGRR